MSISEDALFRAYRHIGRQLATDERLCACGGVLSAPGNDHGRISLEVQRHQRTSMHASWWAWQELLASRPDPEPTPALPAGDMSRPEDGLSAADRTGTPEGVAA